MVWRLFAILPDPDAEKNRIVCGYNPDGKPDDTLLVGRLTNVAGKTLATLVNYACHPTTLAWENKAISPDYPELMAQNDRAGHSGAGNIFTRYVR